MSRRESSGSEPVFRELIAALNGAGGDVVSTDARLDLTRQQRKGVPEIVFAEGKSPLQLRAIVADLLAAGLRAVVSRVDDELERTLAGWFPTYPIERPHGSRALVIGPAGSRPESIGGRVAVLTAGTSDLPIAHEVGIVAREMGCDVELVTDVGVAGLHRLFPPLRQLLDRGVDVFVVVAGMDGALASVVTGLVPTPVIGLPTSIGYGYGGNGEAALMTMLQSCAPGLTVVNIDNAVGAAASAALIANAVARARNERLDGEPS